MMKDVQFPICEKVKKDNDKNEKEKTESPKIDASNEEQSENVNNEETEIEQQSAEIVNNVINEEMKQIEDNEANNENDRDNLAPRLPSTAPKETWLDSVTVLLFIAIVAILLKKFAVVVMEQM